MSEQVVNGPATPSPVARGRAPSSGRLRAAKVGACGLVVLGGLTWAVWPRQAPEPSEPAMSGQGWNMGMTMPDHPVELPKAPAAATSVTALAPSPVTTQQEAVPAPPQQHVMGFWEDSSALQQAAQQVASRAAPSSFLGHSDPDVATPGPGNSNYAQRMQTTRFADTAPTPPHFHVQYTLKKGTIFPCTPASPISSALPGPVQCTVDHDVWSMDGTTILLPRGTQVNGSVERGLATGDERLFLVWADALTPRPDLLAIPLDSPAADELGLTGVPGDVNDHLWKRIKTALLLSAVDIAGSALTAAAQSGTGNTNLNIGNVGGTASTMGQMAFGHDLNIPATLYRGPGQPLSVYVNHYIDLFRFYQNRVVR